jgi:hypothetical protein
MEFLELKDRKPNCWESGDWDGKKSSPLLVYTSKGEYQVATAYSGTMDGSRFLNFYDKNDYEIEAITHWIFLPDFPL